MPDNSQSPRAEFEWPHAPTPTDGQSVSLADLLAGLKRSLWTIACCVLVGLGLGTYYLMRTPATYVADAQVMIEPAKQRLSSLDSNVIDLTVDNAQVESQVEVLRSERVIGDVIAALGLSNDPEFRSEGARSDYERSRIAVGRFKDALSTRRVGQSYVIDVSFRSTDPEKAARIANAVTDAYTRDQLRAKTEVAQQASEWMQQRVTELGVQLNEAAAAVQKFRAANGIVDTANSPPRLLDKLTELEARAQAYRKLYESYVQRLTENQQQESFPVSNARVIAAASTPLAKSFPKTSLVLLLTLLLGLLAGMGIAAVRSVLDGSVRSAKQIRQALRLDCLASLPRFGRGGAAGRLPLLLKTRYSPFGQGLRSVQMSLQALHPKSVLRLGVISLRPGEGKTTVAAGLAAIFAASGSKTLLIDADMRNPELSRRFAPGAAQGLIEALDDPDNSALVFDPETAAYILPLADIDPASKAAELIGPAPLHRLLQRIDAVFATVIVDLPATATAVDARAIGPLLDGCIVVVEWGRTQTDALAETIELLRTSQVRLFGVVMNKVDDGIPPLFGFRLSDVQELVAAARGPVQAEVR